MIPRNWREVFAAIRSGRLGRRSGRHRDLPPSVLSPVAKAELYTAKGSPSVDARPAPGAAGRSARLAAGRAAAAAGASLRGAIQPPADRRRSSRSIGLGYAPAPLPRQAGRRASQPPTQLRAALDPLVKDDDRARRRGAADPDAPSLSSEARAEAGQRVAWTYYLRRPRHRRAPRRRHLAGRRDRRMGDPGGVGLRAGVVADQRLRTPRRALSAKSRPPAREQRARRRRLLLGGARRAGVPPPARGRSAAEGGGPQLPKASTG